MIKKIEAVLNEDVRPSLAQHHGNVVLVDYADQVLRIRLTGTCSGCPSAQVTTESLITAKLQEKLPQIQDVILLTGVSDDLIAQAKAILHSHHAPE
jgi:Fe-S cluster biogenesis protein NfuA